MTVFVTTAPVDNTNDENAPKLLVKEAIGHQLVIRGNEVRTIKVNLHGREQDSPALACDIIDLDATDGPTVYRDQLIFGKVWTDISAPGTEVEYTDKKTGELKSFKSRGGFAYHVQGGNLAVITPINKNGYVAPQDAPTGRAEKFFADNKDPFGDSAATVADVPTTDGTDPWAV